MKKLFAGLAAIILGGLALEVKTEEVVIGNRAPLINMLLAQKFNRNFSTTNLLALIKNLPCAEARLDDDHEADLKYDVAEKANKEAENQEVSRRCFLFVPGFLQCDNKEVLAKFQKNLASDLGSEEFPLYKRIIQVLKKGEGLAGLEKLKCIQEDQHFNDDDFYLKEALLIGLSILEKHPDNLAGALQETQKVCRDNSLNSDIEEMLFPLIGVMYDKIDEAQLDKIANLLEKDKKEIMSEIEKVLDGIGNIEEKRELSESSKISLLFNKKVIVVCLFVYFFWFMHKLFGKEIYRSLNN
ncbi:MAG: hypothetical protein WCD44_00145 [Candidatus Babeliales bacterium]